MDDAIHVADSGAKLAEASQLSDWRLIYTHYGKEFEAACNLSAQGFNTLLPVTWERRSKGVGRSKFVEVPFFKKYCFAEFPDEFSEPVSHTRGVSHIIAFGERPVIVPYSVIDEIRGRMELGYIRLDDEPVIRDCPYKKGEHVKICAGPLAGFTGIFKSGVPAKDRATLLINYFERQTEIQVGLGQIEPLTFSFDYV